MASSGTTSTFRPGDSVTPDTECVPAAPFAGVPRLLDQLFHFENSPVSGISLTRLKLTFPAGRVR